MREIKFRAWNKNKEIMVYKNEDGERDYWDGVNANNVEIVNNRFECANEEGLIYSQYTGLKDKNGTEIYEGDIVITHENRIQKVIWHNNGFKLEYKFKRSYRGESYWETRKDIELSESNDKRWGIEVIGNIYENPELLKEGE